MRYGKLKLPNTELIHCILLPDILKETRSHIQNCKRELLVYPHLERDKCFNIIMGIYYAV